MDQKLAELYGTTQPDETDVEKLAAAQLAESLSDGQEVDVDNLSDEDVEALASQVLASENGEEETPAGDQEEDPQEKVAEADYLGRVMAHAYVQELRGIEKEAAGMPGKVLAHLKGMGGKAKELGKKSAEKAKALGGAAKGKVMAHRGKAGLAAGAAAGAAAAHGAHKMKKSAAEPSALDTLAERRAIEICEANGIDPSKLTPVETEVEKTSAPEALEAAVNARAVELLAKFGVEVSAEAPAEE